MNINGCANILRELIQRFSKKYIRIIIFLGNIVKIKNRMICVYEGRISMSDILFLGVIAAAYVMFNYFVNWCEGQVEKANN